MITATNTSVKPGVVPFIRTAVILVILLGTVVLGPTTRAIAAIVVDFRQSANKETNGTVTGLGNLHWINSIVRQANSRYFEGMSCFQRIIFRDVPPTIGNHHSLSFNHQFTKGGIHAYDFLTSWTQAQTDDAAALGVSISVNQCGVEIGPPASLATAVCIPLHSGGIFADVSVPDDPFVSKDGSTAARIAAYERGHGNRTIRIYGNAVISNAAITLSHDVANGADPGDSFVNYILTWDSASEDIIIEMAGHLAITGDGRDETWGPGLGSAQSNGAAYQFRLDKLGGAIVDGMQTQVISLDSADNQIEGADVFLPPPPCDVVGPTIVCGSAVFAAMSMGPNLTYSWSVTGNGTILGSASGSSVTVLAGAAASYTVSVIILASSNGKMASSTCSKTVTVNPLPTCSITGGSSVFPRSIGIPFFGPSGMAAYSWTVSGNPRVTINGSSSSQVVRVNVDDNAIGRFALMLTVVNVYGCASTCVLFVGIAPGQASAGVLRSSGIAEGLNGEIEIAFLEIQAPVLLTEGSTVPISVVAHLTGNAVPALVADPNWVLPPVISIRTIGIDGPSLLTVGNVCQQTNVAIAASFVFRGDENRTMTNITLFPLSFIQLQASLQSSNHSVLLHLKGPPTNRYVLEATDALGSPQVWRPFWTNPPNGDCSWLHPIPRAVQTNHRYFRARQLPP